MPFWLYYNNNITVDNANAIFKNTVFSLSNYTQHCFINCAYLLFYYLHNDSIRQFNSYHWLNISRKVVNCLVYLLRFVLDKNILTAILEFQMNSQGF